MNDLGLSDFKLVIEQFGPGFSYRVSFSLDAVSRMYRGDGTAPSPSQCFDVAMAYLSECIREAITTEE